MPPKMNEDPEGYWNEQAGPKWVRAQDAIDHTLAPITKHLLGFAEAKRGERILDIGCGCGSTTLALANQVGTTGQVVGIDVSKPMLTEAQKRGSNHPQVEWLLADAGRFDFSDLPSFNLLSSRFGVMFFVDPISAFSNLRSALRPDGRLTFACWQAFEDNPWLSYLFEAFTEFEPTMPNPDDGPGPFSLSDARRLNMLMETAGYRDIQVQSFQTPLTLGQTPEEVWALMSEVGPFSRILAETDASDVPALHERARSFLEAEFRKGLPERSAAIWTVRARPT